MPDGLEYDELLQAATELVADATEVHALLLQDALGVGYGRARRILDQLVEVGVLVELADSRYAVRRPAG